MKTRTPILPPPMRRLDSGERRISSDTLRMDKSAIDAELAKMRAGTPEPELAPVDEREDITMLECPACGGIERDPPCATCVGAGVVSVAARAAWLREHGGTAAVMSCPRCEGEGDVLEAIVAGGNAWHRIPCPSCKGSKSVPVERIEPR